MQTRIFRTGLFSVAYFLFSLFTPLVLFLLPKQRVKKIFGRLDAQEEERRIQAFRSFVRPGESVLDIGAGTGRFAKLLAERLDLKVTGVDVCDYADPDIPFFTYDGKTLPFPDKSFDVVFFGYVLHHIRHQEIIMKEACRVARKYILILEDVYTNPLERAFTCWNDVHNNVLHGWVKFKKGYLKGNPAGMPIPWAFRSIQGWNRFFEQFPVASVSQEIRRPAWKPLTKITFCLKMESA